MSDSAVGDAGVRAALAVPAFRRLWYSLSLSSLGDWLGLLATTAMAAALTSDSSAEANYAVAGVFILRLVPALIFAPIAGVIADRLDRRMTMIVTDIGRAGLFVSIPIVGTMWWLLVATFLIEVLSLFWIPAKEATVPNLVPAEQAAVREPAEPRHRLRLRAHRRRAVHRCSRSSAVCSAPSTPSSSTTPRPWRCG